MKKILLCLSLTGMVHASFAQQTAQPKEKKFEHHVGVQINELVRQIFNFSNSNTNTNNNPYLLVYSINSVKSGWGARIGIGYTYRSFADDDGVTKKQTDINDAQIRLGVEKAFRLSGKWMTGVGVDGLYNINDDVTNSTVRSFDTTTTITDTRIDSYGGGVMAWLRYSISKNVVIGTETSFYYTTGKQKQEISVTQRNFGQQQWTTTVSKIDNNTSEASFRLPVAIYVLIKF